MSELTPLTARHSDEMDLRLQPFSNLLREFYRLTGNVRAANLDDLQISRLRSYGREVDCHHLNDQTILVLSDDLLQRLVVVQNANVPHYAFVAT